MTTRLRRIRANLTLATRRRSMHLGEGTHAANLSGSGTDFNDLREYVVGDAVGGIDWRASARLGHLVVRRHFAERHLTLMLVVATGRDLAGMATPTLRTRALAAEVAGTLGVVGAQGGDTVGMVWWDGTRPRATPPTTRMANLETLLSTLEGACDESAAAAPLARLLETASTSMRRSGVVAVIADDVDIDDDLTARLASLRARHAVLFVTIRGLDPTSPEAVRRGVHAVAGGPSRFLGDPALVVEAARDREARRERRMDVLTRLGITHSEVDGRDDVTATVLDLVRRMPRARR